MTRRVVRGACLRGNVSPGAESRNRDVGKLRKGVRRVARTRLVGVQAEFSTSYTLPNPTSPGCLFKYSSISVLRHFNRSMRVPSTSTGLFLTFLTQLATARKRQAAAASWLVRGHDSPVYSLISRSDKRRNPGGKKRVVSPSAVPGNLPECNRVGSMVTFS